MRRLRLVAPAPLGEGEPPSTGAARRRPTGRWHRPVTAAVLPTGQAACHGRMGPGPLPWRPGHPTRISARTRPRRGTGISGPASRGVVPTRAVAGRRFRRFWRRPRRHIRGGASGELPLRPANIGALHTGSVDIPTGGRAGRWRPAGGPSHRPPLLRVLRQVGAGGEPKIAKNPVGGLHGSRRGARVRRRRTEGRHSEATFAPVRSKAEGP